MTTDSKHKDPVLREALRLEQEDKPHFQLRDGWQEAVISQVQPRHRLGRWAIAAAIVTLFVGVATVLWQKEPKADSKGLAVEAPKEEPPVVTAQVAVAEANVGIVTMPKPKKSTRPKRLPQQQATTEPAEEPIPEPLSANRDRMRQAMFKEMNRRAVLSDFETEKTDEI